MLTVDEKIEHLKSLGIKGDFTEVRKMYSGEKFDTNDIVYKQVVALSNELCDNLTKVVQDMFKSPEIAERAVKEKDKILKALFPGHGDGLFGGGEGLRAIIGLVDLEGMNYINARVDFGVSSLVHIGLYTFLANNVTFGDSEVKNNQLGKIEVGGDTWICAGVNVTDNATVSGRSVVTLGSVVTDESALEDGSIIVGEPAYSKHTIDENKTSSNMPIERTDAEIEQIINHVKKLGISGDFTQYIKQLKNLPYNTLDPTISRIFELTHTLCAEYNDKNTTIERKKEILDIVFFMHGNDLQVGDSLYVDIIGTVKIGNNVHIGNGTSFCGNIEIGDNVNIEDNCLMQAIGHKVHYLGRKLTRDENGRICEFNVPSFIKIVNGISSLNSNKNF